MGQQQLLLIVVGVVIVGIAVVVGIQMFGQQSASSNLDAVISDLQNIGAKAHQYYTKPTGMGGGGRDFTTDLNASDQTTLAVLTMKATSSGYENDNGLYTITNVTQDVLTLQGVGVEDGDGDGTNCTVTLVVDGTDASSDSLSVSNR